MYLTLGLMKAGKSKKLITHYRLFKQREDLKVGIFTYKPHDINKFTEVTTRAEGFEPIPNVLNLSKIYLSQDVLNLLSSYDIIFIDEIQFAPKNHLQVLVELSKVRTLCCYGLYIDFQDKLFESIEYFLQVEKDEDLEIIYLEAKCEECGEKAKHNIRITNETELFVTDKESYKTVCAECKGKIEG